MSVRLHFLWTTTWSVGDRWHCYGLTSSRIEQIQRRILHRSKICTANICANICGNIGATLKIPQILAQIFAAKKAKIYTPKIFAQIFAQILVQCKKYPKYWRKYLRRKKRKYMHRKYLRQYLRKYWRNAQNTANIGAYICGEKSENIRTANICANICANIYGKKSEKYLWLLTLLFISRIFSSKIWAFFEFISDSELGIQHH